MSKLGEDANGGQNEAAPPDVCLDAQFTVSKSRSDVDGQEHSCLAPLLGQTTQSRTDRTATTRKRFASTSAGSRRIVFAEPLSITATMGFKRGHEHER